MQEIKEVHHYDETSSSSTKWVVVFAVLVLAIIVFAFMAWQPWLGSAPSSTTIIHDSQPAQAAPAPTTTIINPPPTVVNPPKTEIHINESTGGGSTGTGGKETTGGETTGGETTTGTTTGG